MPVKKIGADDSFFRIGSDSISAMKLAGYASAQGLSLTVDSIFLIPVLDNMAKSIATSSENGERSNSTPQTPNSFSLLSVSNMSGLMEDTIRPRFVDLKSTTEDIMPASNFQA
jgi:aryl carrier-like protein